VHNDYKSVEQLEHLLKQNAKPTSRVACSLGLSATSQQYFSLRKNQPPATSQQYFSLEINQHQSSATSVTWALIKRS
jgi:hypothetical protein